jgi:hypothetical protein
MGFDRITKREYAFSHIKVIVAMTVPAKRRRKADVKFLCYNQKRIIIEIINQKKILHLIVDYFVEIVDLYWIYKHLENRIFLVF